MFPFSLTNQTSHYSFYLTPCPPLYLTYSFFTLVNVIIQFVHLSTPTKGSNDLRKTKFNFEINRSLFLSFFKLVFHFCSVFFIAKADRHSDWIARKTLFFLFLFLLSTLTFKHTCTTNLHTNTYTPLLPSHTHTHIHKKFLHTWIKSRTRTHSHSLTPIHNSPLTLHMHTPTHCCCERFLTHLWVHTHVVFLSSHTFFPTQIHTVVYNHSLTPSCFFLSLSPTCADILVHPANHPPKNIRCSVVKAATNPQQRKNCDPKHFFRFKTCCVATEQTNSSVLFSASCK